MLDSNSLDLEGCNVRLRDGASSLVDQYGDLLRSAKSHGEVEQQAGELKTATLAQSVVLTTESLMQVADELLRAKVVGDHAAVGAEVASAASSHEAVAAAGEARLKQVAREMQAALRELETSYYSGSEPVSEADR